MTLGRLDHDLTHSRNVVEVDEVLVVVEVDVVKVLLLLLLLYLIFILGPLAPTGTQTFSSSARLRIGKKSLYIVHNYVECIDDSYRHDHSGLLDTL